MSWITLFDWLLLGCNRWTGIRHRKQELRKLQVFADAACRLTLGSDSAQDVLILHFLVPAESDIDTVKRTSWHGRILALAKMIEQTFERTCRSLTKQSEDTKQTMAKIEKEVIQVCEHSKDLTACSDGGGQGKS